MANITDTEKLNLAFKLIFGVQGLSNTSDSLGLSWYEEKNAWIPFMLSEEIYMDSIPHAANKTAANNNVTANPTILERRDIKLSLVDGTNGRGWAAYQTYNNESSGLYGDWVLPHLWGQGYAMQLFQDNGSGTGVGTEITTTEGVWIGVYKMGFVVLGAGFTASEILPTPWTTPLWARVFRYIGGKGISGGTANVSLDDAYNHGRTITADAGPVVINASNNYAALQITPISYTPSTGLAAGQICINGGVIYAYDGTRGKWLSASPATVDYQTRVGDANYLTAPDRSDVNAGYAVPRGCTLIGISAAGGAGNQTKSFSIRKNGNITDLATLSLTAGKYSSTTTDINFSAGDVVQVYCSAGGAPIFSPRVSLTIAWRI